MVTRWGVNLMPFNGGGGGALPAHEHTNIANDGGPLDFNNTTIGSMNAGDLTYSDGAALQTLAYPAVPANETLTAATLSTAPSWSPAAGGALTELIDSVTLGAPAATITSSFAAVAQSTVSKFFVVFNTQKTVSNSIVGMQLNGITSATYDSNRILANASGTGVQQSVNQAGANNFRFISNNHGNEIIAFIDIACNAVSEHLSFSCNSGTEDIWCNTSGVNSTAAQTSLSEVSMLVDLGSFDINTRLDVYKINI